MRKSLDEKQLHAQEGLHRGLKNRHVQMIAIGGTIGVGLFLGSAMAIQKAGPGLALSYAIGGLVMFLIMRALGELLLYRPVSGSFSAYAEGFVGPWAGFVTGWSYWFMWVVIWHGGDHRCGRLCPLLVSPNSPVDPGIDNPWPLVLRKPNHGEAIWRNRVLVCADQGDHHRCSNRYWLDDHSVQIRRSWKIGKLLQPLDGGRIFPLGHSACFYRCRWLCSPTKVWN